MTAPPLTTDTAQFYSHTNHRLGSLTVWAHDGASDDPRAEDEPREEAEEAVADCRDLGSEGEPVDGAEEEGDERPGRDTGDLHAPDGECCGEGQAGKDVMSSA